MTKTKACPECKAPMAEAIYGMPSFEYLDNPKYLIMGCLVDEDLQVFKCNQCSLEIYASGKVTKATNSDQ